MAIDTPNQEATVKEACTEGCCDPAGQPGLFNKFTLVGVGVLGALFGGVALLQALFG